MNDPIAPGATLEVTVAKDRYSNATRNEVVNTNTNWTNEAQKTSKNTSEVKEKTKCGLASNKTIIKTKEKN